MTENERLLVAGLKAMAAQETRAPSAELEQRLLGQIAKKKIRWAAPAGMAALAAAVILAVVFRPVREPPRIPIEPAPPPIVKELQAVAAATPVRTPAIAKRPKSNRKALPEARQEPLMRIPYSAALEPTDRAELVRVSLPVAQLLYWGFPVSGTEPDIRLNADVLVGGDGLARAVRLIRTGETQQ